MMETASSYSPGMMLNDKDDDSPSKCRDRRRRRIEMRRMAAQSSALSYSSSGHRANNFAARDPEAASFCSVERSSLTDPSLSGSSIDAVEGNVTEVAAPALSAPVQQGTLSGEEEEPAVHGAMSVSGRSREMEDAVCVRTGLCRPEINGHRPVHYFGVFDGHGGSHVAALCRETMHVILEEELMRMSCGEDDTESVRAEKWREVMKRTFWRTDELAMTMCVCGNMRGSNCGCQSVKVALGGSTAVVAVMTADMIVVANCGDSRAVLCRNGRAIPLSRDHKPDRPDELARIEASGGRVIFVNGARVEGILAMSRAIGDKYLKSVVVSEPEITFTRREPGDNCLIIASDGLWDVMSNELACQVACECLHELDPGNPDDATSRPRQGAKDEGQPLYPSRSVLAAALLTRLALGRKSQDNISVIVVNLAANRCS
ncbi:hypothetical protein MLD38_008957 [Melastoma candidum]|uniref:Uncharacterized protein n=1 Tax=Melastoma candidum TaxID=119954 RepID=A0ACB9S4J0_9MYRT|nr:hypothetical protein MLD38_008957 [Melastoma candidum]